MKDRVVQSRPRCLFCARPLLPKFETRTVACLGFLASQPTRVRGYGFRGRWCNLSHAVEWATEQSGGDKPPKVPARQLELELDRAHERYARELERRALAEQHRREEQDVAQEVRIVEELERQKRREREGRIAAEMRQDEQERAALRDAPEQESNERGTT